MLLADVLSRRGNARQAAQTLHEVLAYTPDDQEARRSLAAMYRHLGEPRKAIETIEGLINQLEKSGEPKDVAALAAALEEYEQAVAEHEKDFREEREHTIRRLREIVHRHVARRPEAAYDEDAMMLEELEQVDDDEVPIVGLEREGAGVRGHRGDRGHEARRDEEELPTCPSTTSGRPTS